MIEILEKVELDTVERKVVFPQLFDCRSAGPIAVFADECGLWANGDESRLRLSTFKGDRKLKELKLQITAGDGTEWPRVVKCRTHGTLYLWISPLKAVALQSIDVGFSHRAGEVMADESVTVHNTKPLPPGTRTILTLREGEVECETQEPVDWFPEKVFGCSVKRMRHGGFSLGCQNNVYLFTSNGVRELHEFTGKLIAEQEAKAGS